MSRIVIVTCEFCEKEFEREVRYVNRNKKKGRNNYCNRSCASNARVRDGLLSDLYPYAGNMYDEFSKFRSILRVVRSRNRAKDVETKINLIDLRRIWEDQKGKCPYTNIEMLLPRATPEWEKLRSPRKASLDRIDSSKGYLSDNIQFVPLSINLAKNTFTDIEFKEFVEIMRVSMETIV